MKTLELNEYDNLSKEELIEISGGEIPGGYSTGSACRVSTGISQFWKGFKNQIDLVLKQCAC